jgi:probable addiction module antidote protein
MNKSKITENTSSYHDEFIKSLTNPQEADFYLRIAMEEYHEEGDIEALLIALRNISEARGGMSRLAQRTHLNRQNLYNALSKNGNPRLTTFELILKGLGYRLAIQPDHPSGAAPYS